MGSIVLQVNGSTVGNVADGAGVEIVRSVTEQDSARLVTALHDYYRSHFGRTGPDADGPPLEPTVENIIRVWWDDVVRQALKHVERYESRQNAKPAVSILGGDIAPVTITAAMVDAEMERRASSVTFSGKSYDLRGQRLADLTNAGMLALGAIMGGKLEGDLRWSDPDSDFTWIAADNSIVPMDAQTCWALAQTAAAWRQSCTSKARVLKAMNPIPSDYTADSYWA